MLTMKPYGTADGSGKRRYCTCGNCYRKSAMDRGRDRARENRSARHLAQEQVDGVFHPAEITLMLCDWGDCPLGCDC